MCLRMRCSRRKRRPGNWRNVGLFTSLCTTFLLDPDVPSPGLKTSETEIAAHLAQIEDLEQTLFELRGEIAGGRHVPPGVRILSLKDNPEQQWVDLRQAAMDRLRGENEALMRRLREVEEMVQAQAPAPNGGDVAQMEQPPGRDDLVPRQSWEIVNREKTELEEVVRQKEKRLLRLKQVCISLLPAFLPSRIVSTFLMLCRP